MKIKKLDTLNVNFETELKAHVGFDADSSENIIKTVSDIVERLKKEGDTALINFTNRFDQMNISSASELEISSKELSSALDNLPGTQKKSLEIAAQRIVNYHNKQKIDSWSYDDETGSSF
jgi:histidinol dehydrogenase